MTAPKYVSARDGKKNSVIYVDAEGKEHLHSGGTRAWRNNNPGNLSKAEKSGLAIGVGGPFAVFPDKETGKGALKFVLLSVYKNTRLDNVFEKYAPAKDNNDPQHYTKLVKKFTGLEGSRTISSLNASELDKFMGAIERVEGWQEGKIEAIPFAQQFELKGVDGKPMSGIDYIIRFFTSSGEEKKIKGKTDEKGKTDVAVTEKRTSVSLDLPRPDPGQSLKGSGAKAGAKTDPTKKIEAACVNSKPWYAFSFGNADECLTEAKNQGGPATASGKGAAQTSAPKSETASKKQKSEAPAPEAPVATVKQAGAIKASTTVDKAENKVSTVVKEPGVFVTWEFDTSHGSKKDLKGLPYLVVEVSGNSVTPLPDQKVRLLVPKKIRQKVPFGKTVALLLGNDAKKRYRTRPLFAVTADQGLSDIVVKIKEQRGTDYDADLEKPSLVSETATKKTYNAELHGTTWFNFSHKFTAEEAAELTSDAPAEVKEAVISIFRGDPVVANGAIKLNVQKTDGTMLKVTWLNEAFENCRENIPAITSLEAAKRELIPRVNPNTYQAFIQAALEMGAQEMDITSGWRPMLGSVLHRIGVGLDVKRIKVNGANRSYSRAATAEETALSNLRNEKSDLEKKKNRTQAENTRLNVLNAEEPAAVMRAQTAVPLEHADLKAFTTKLRQNTEVRQTFDPWQMESNTADKAAPTVNILSNGNEVLHKTHLHITVFDEELGHGH
jgi:hypothetical protein